MAYWIITMKLPGQTQWQFAAEGKASSPEEAYLTLTDEFQRMNSDKFKLYPVQDDEDGNPNIYTTEGGETF